MSFRAKDLFFCTPKNSSITAFNPLEAPTSLRYDFAELSFQKPSYQQTAILCSGGQTVHRQPVVGAAGLPISGFQCLR